MKAFGFSISLTTKFVAWSSGSDSELTDHMAFRFILTDNSAFSCHVANFFRQNTSRLRNPQEDYVHSRLSLLGTLFIQPPFSLPCFNAISCKTRTAKTTIKRCRWKVFLCRFRQISLWTKLRKRNYSKEVVINFPKNFKKGETIF